MAASPSRRSNIMRGLSATSNLAIKIPKGFQENLLVNSLTLRLKRKPNENSDRENPTRASSNKPPKPARKQSTRVSSRKDESAAQLRDGTSVSPSASRLGSGISSCPSLSRLDRMQLQPGTNNADSDKIYLSGRRELPSRSSRRTLSGVPYNRSSSGSRAGRISVSSSFYPRSESTGLVFEPSGPDHTIKVIKRDGVFKPVDKYAAPRQGNRDNEEGNRGLACDYELFTLPLSCNKENTVVSYEKNDLPVSRGKSDISKKSMRVSWHNALEHEQSDFPDMLENRVDVTSTPIVNPNTNLRGTYKNSVAFKKPVHSTGKSSIKSIGVKWSVPNIAVEEEESPQQQPRASSSSSSPSKPMWSWLLTPEPPVVKPQVRVKSVGQLSRGSRSKESPCPSSTSLGRSTSLFDIRTQHCRDVHPVATAMDRQGTSVTKTKWHVPSSTSGSLSAKQVAMERLQMVKRPGKRLVYDNPLREAQLKMQSVEEQVNNQLELDEEDQLASIGEDQQERSDDGMTTSTATARRDDTNSSPTKSLSTYY